MKTLGIDVNFVNGGPGKGKALQANPKHLEIELKSFSGKAENALVTWTFKGLPAGLTPAITFDSSEVIASGPTATPGAVPKITFEVKLPATAKSGDKVYASYKISALSGLAETSPSPDAEGDGLVVVSSSDPPGGSKVVPADTHVTA